eukprot:TRINITY_DN25081_c0_g1_i1.p1 TRINITY_DN25081_c0_g1~~TRINITY_DN25081_c0_g1_i1.p1  ORF type:complete len:171 (+),score=21.96 TRINITY_DN25081_c0_g1_i1:56-514(+)
MSDEEEETPAKHEKQWQKFSKGLKGYLVMVIVKKGRHNLEKVAPGDILTGDSVIRSQQMNTVYFQYNTLWKVNLDFKKPVRCIGNAVRETTDWILCHTEGRYARLDINERKIYLDNCTPCIASTVKQLIEPFSIILTKSEKGENWLVSKVYR